MTGLSLGGEHGDDRSQGTDTVRIELGDDGVAVIRFTDPDRNALHDEMYPPIIATIQALAASGDADDCGDRRGFCVLCGWRCARRQRQARRCAEAHAGGARRQPRGERSCRGAAPRSPDCDHRCGQRRRRRCGHVHRVVCDLRIVSPRATFIGGWARLGFSGRLRWCVAVDASGRALEGAGAVGDQRERSMRRRRCASRYGPSCCGPRRIEAAWREYARPARFAAGPRRRWG